MRCGREQFWCGGDRVAVLRPTLAHLLLLGEHAGHRALRAVIDPFIKQRGIDLRWSQIDEARRMQHVEHLLALRW